MNMRTFDLKGTPNVCVNGPSGCESSRFLSVAFIGMHWEVRWLHWSHTGKPGSQKVNGRSNMQRHVALTLWLYAHHPPRTTS